MPVVSVVIPTRNRPDLLLRAVRSALAQSFTDLEVVVVIDGPDEQTRLALDALQDPRVSYVEMEQSVGGSEARNQGVLRAAGKWIALLDDDDEWMPEKIQLQYRIAESANNQHVLVFTRMITRYPTEEFLWPRRLPRVGEKMSDYLFVRKGLSFGEGFLQTSSFFASRQMFLEIPFRKGQQRFQDTDWLLRASAHDAAQVVVLPDPLVIYYMNDSLAVSRKSDWEYLFNWANGNLQLFTPRAYSYFLLTQCMPRAAKQNEPLAVKVRLMWQSISKGSPTLNCLFLGILYGFVPETARHSVRDYLNSSRRKFARAS